MADSSSADWTRNAAGLYFTISSKFKDFVVVVVFFILIWREIALYINIV